MADFRPIKTTIWHDGWFYSLKTEEKLVWIFLLTNEHLHISGIYQLPKPLVRAFVGVDSAEEILAKFENDGKIVMKEGWIFIKNYLKNQVKQINKFDNIVKSIMAYLSDNPKVITLFDLHNEGPYKGLLSPLVPPPVNIKGKVKGKVKGKDKYKEGEPSAPLADEVKESRPSKPEASMSWLQAIPPEDVSKMAEAYRVDEAFVTARAQDVTDYCEAKGKRYADYKAALRNFIKSHIQKHPDSVKKALSQAGAHVSEEKAREYAEIARPRSPEEQARVEEKLREMRENMRSIGLSKK